MLTINFQIYFSRKRFAKRLCSTPFSYFPTRNHDVPAFTCWSVGSCYYKIKIHCSSQFTNIIIYKNLNFHKYSSFTNLLYGWYYWVNQNSLQNMNIEDKNFIQTTSFDAQSDAHVFSNSTSWPSHKLNVKQRARHSLTVELSIARKPR